MNVMQNNSPANATRVFAFRFGNQCGQARGFVVLVVGLALGLTVGALWFRRAAPAPPVAASESSMPAGLSQPTIELLQHLSAPVEIRFYAVTRDPEGNAESKAFVGRINAMLSEYERAGGGKIQLKHFDAGARDDATAAAAEGVEPIHFRRSDAEYLGLAIVGNGQKIVLPRLSSEWEAALESDVSRAIARVTSSVATPVPTGAQVSATLAPIDPVITEELVRIIPDLASRSFDDAAKILRESALKNFTATVNEMQTKVQTAEKQLADSQDKNSPADQQAAMKQLQRIQSEQTEKLKAITAQLQARIAGLERLKGVNHSTSK